MCDVRNCLSNAYAFRSFCVLAHAVKRGRQRFQPSEAEVDPMYQPVAILMRRLLSFPDRYTLGFFLTKFPVPPQPLRDDMPVRFLFCVFMCWFVLVVALSVLVGVRVCPCVRVSVYPCVVCVRAVSVCRRFSCREGHCYCRRVSMQPSKALSWDCSSYSKVRPPYLIA